MIVPTYREYLFNTGLWSYSVLLFCFNKMVFSITSVLTILFNIVLHRPMSPYHPMSPYIVQCHLISLNVALYRLTSLYIAQCRLISLNVASYRPIFSRIFKTILNIVLNYPMSHFITATLGFRVGLCTILTAYSPLPLNISIFCNMLIP